MKVKRLLALLLATCLLMTLVACSGNGDTNVTTTTDGTVTTTTVNNDEDVVDPVGDETTTDPNATTTTVTDKDGNVVTTTTVQGQTTTTVRTKKTLVNATTATRVTADDSGQLSVSAPITIKEGTTPLEKGMNFGGETFTYAYYGATVSDGNKERIANFEKKYNCKVDARGLAGSEYSAGLASQLAASEPYDLVFLYGTDYPSQITANVMMPLNDYITTADLWTEKSVTEGGFSYSLMEALSLNGNIYCVAGAYLNTPAVIYYNKKIFSDAGYDGNEDPLALYNAGKWSWEKLYEMLSDIQDVDKGLYGMNTISPYYDHTFINSYGTDLAKLNSAGKLVQNLGDSQLYKAFQMLQQYNFGQQRVTDPNNPDEHGRDQFLNGTTAALLGSLNYYGPLTRAMDAKTYSAFGSKAQQKSNLGCVPVPVANSDGKHAIWAWMGYGVGNGTDENGRNFALTFAKYDSTCNQSGTFDESYMPAEVIKFSRAIMDGDNLIAPLNGFKSSAGSLDKMRKTLASTIALKGENITKTLKAYEKQVQTIIDTALKG